MVHLIRFAPTPKDATLPLFRNLITVYAKKNSVETLKAFLGWYMGSNSLRKELLDCSKQICQHEGGGVTKLQFVAP